MSNLIHFIAEDSNHVRRLSYDPEQELLHVTFSNDSRYTHAHVPPHVFSAMTRFSSIGKYYHRVIKVHYPLMEKHGTDKREDNN